MEGEIEWGRRKEGGESRKYISPPPPSFLSNLFFGGREEKRGLRHTHKKPTSAVILYLTHEIPSENIEFPWDVSLESCHVKICRFCRNSMFVVFSVPKISVRIRFCLLQPLQNGNGIEWKALVVISC